MATVKTRPTVFYRQHDWEFTPQAIKLWNSVIKGSGLVAIKDPEQYGLKEGVATSAPDSMVYGVSFTHQYHCLVSLCCIDLS